MLKYLCSLVLVASHYLLLAQAGTFTTLPTEIDSTGYTQGVNQYVFSCYNSANNQIVFSWSDTTLNNPWYCIYDVTTNSFSTLPTQIDSGGAAYDVFCFYNSTNNQVVFSWADDNAANPWYCIYDANGGSFSTEPTQIDHTGYTSYVVNDLFCCYNSVNNQIFFSWADATYPHNPWYCTYDVSGGSFSTLPTQLDRIGYTTGVHLDVMSCYNSKNNQVVFSWTDVNQQNPWYAIYTEPSSSTLNQALSKYSPLKLLKGVH